MAEFSLIDRFCLDVGPNHSATKLSVGDDAAIVSIPSNKELAISVDTMVEGVHFYPGANAGDVAHKLLAVNLSDLAAMGASPKWATLAITLPSYDESWMQLFSDTLRQVAEKYSLQLIGGDTTQGSLTLSLQIMGLLDKGKGLTRSNARVGDDLYVSNTLGDAALALSCIEGQAHIKGMNLDVLRESLDRPVPQVELGKGLLNIADACIDVSDGLISDLGHIAAQSNVSFNIDVEKLPISSIYKQYLGLGGSHDLALNGGDDYQLAFTAKPDRRGEIDDLAKSLDIPISKIGKAIAACEEPIQLHLGDSVYRLSDEKERGYEHFTQQAEQGA